MPNYRHPGDDGALKNSFGVTKQDKLEPLEAMFVAARIDEIQAGQGPQGQFDSEHLKAIHYHLFQDVYEWAGHTRDERMKLSDGTVASEPIMQKSEGQPFAIGPTIPADLEQISSALKGADCLRGLPREEFAVRSADVMADLNSVHPFREGNGRTQRVFMEELAKEAGHDLDFSVVSKERMIQASITAHEQGDPSMMRRMFVEISDPERVALLQQGTEKLQAAFDREGERRGQPAQQWNDRYVASLDPDHETTLVMAGVAGDQFMARTKSGIFFGRSADLPDPQPERDETFTYAPKAGRSLGGAVDATTAGAEKLADSVGDLSEAGIHSLADTAASLLGGGPSVAPERPAPPAPQHEEEVERSRRGRFIEASDQEMDGEHDHDAEKDGSRGHER